MEPEVESISGFEGGFKGRNRSGQNQERERERVFMRLYVHSISIWQLEMEALSRAGPFRALF